jgi:hypothetical protein
MIGFNFVLDELTSIRPPPEPGRPPTDPGRRVGGSSGDKIDIAKPQNLFSGWH